MCQEKIKIYTLLQKDLFEKVWHTDEELISDENGYISFRGFCREYVAELDGEKFTFSIHKEENNTYKFNI